jgi:DNA-binding TFAR19-related protein (PDSD5 family)
MPVLQVVLERLKNIFHFPRFHLSNYFSDLRTEVDLAFATKDLNETDLTLREQIKKNWTDMILKINEFEQECLVKLKNNSFNNSQITDQTEQLINLVESNFINKKIEEDILKELIDGEILKLEKILFLKKLMIFLHRKNGHYAILCKKLDHRTTVGKLIYITNEYLGKKCVEILKKK